MYAKTFLFGLLLFCIGCGKPPILNRIAKTNIIDQITHLEQEKFPSTQREFSLNWQVPPDLDSLSVVVINFTQSLPTQYFIESEIVMKEHGHGSSPIVIEYGQNRDHVILSELSFFMTGKWTLIITLKEHNQIVDQWEKDIYL